MKTELINKTYIICSIVAIASFFIAYFLPTEEILKGIIALPGVSALFGALWLIHREHIGHERQKEIQDREHNFHLSVSSHMADVAFDKHVEFSQEYIGKFNEILTKIIPQGNVGIPPEFEQLKQIRNKYQAWLNKNIIIDLLDLENLIYLHNQKGTQAKNSQIGDTKTKLYDEAKQLFQQIKGEDFVANSYETQSLISKVIFIVQEMIGIKELTELRQLVLGKAVKQLIT